MTFGPSAADLRDKEVAGTDAKPHDGGFQRC
jgi:hypothetical protein